MSSCALYEANVTGLLSSLHKQDMARFREELNQLEKYLHLWELELRYTNESRVSLNQSKKRYNDAYNELLWAERSHPKTEPSMEYAAEIQKEDMASLDRTLASIHDSKEVAIETGIQLKAQTDQLAAIADDVEETDGTLASATHTITQMAKRIGSDKVVWVFAFLIVVAIGVAIFLT